MGQGVGVRFGTARVLESVLGPDPDSATCDRESVNLCLSLQNVIVIEVILWHCRKDQMRKYILTAYFYTGRVGNFQ